MPRALEWKIMSMQILLREGFYSLKRNLPLGNWTVFFFSFYHDMLMHTRAGDSRTGLLSHSDYQKC